jgi:hypothetical protein
MQDQYEECVRLRDAYWRAIAEAARSQELFRACPAGEAAERDRLNAARIVADDARVAARDARPAHLEKCSVGGLGTHR